MMDYKIDYAIEDENETHVHYTVYEGAVTTEDERDPLTDEVGPVTRYRRSAILLEAAATYPIGTDIEQELNVVLAQLAAQRQDEAIEQQQL